MVFQELAPSQAHKIKSRGDLESELFGPEHVGEGAPRVRENEGEAAEYGIYYDDTEYDYMQHMRDLNGGDGSGESYFVEAPAKKEKGTAKGRVRLEDALRDVSLVDRENIAGESGDGGQLLDEDVLPSKVLKKTTYQDQQDVPDVLAGFQPDMDPRLREVLEALEDDAYVDDEEDLFEELAKEREEISLAEFEELGFEEIGNNDDEGGWETDDTAKPKHKYKDKAVQDPSSTSSTIDCKDAGPKQDPNSTSTTVNSNNAGPDHGDGDWMAEFSKFKNATKASKKGKAALPSNAELQSSIMTGTSLTGGRRKKRKGAMTSSTGYSMTSSSLFRTEGLTLLDARFDKIEEEYADDEPMDDDDEDGGASVMTGKLSNVSGLSRSSNLSTASKWSTTSSQAPSLVMTKELDGIMDEFLGGYSMSGKRRVKKGGYQSGIEQLDEIRKELGPPRLTPQRAI